MIKFNHNRSGFIKDKKGFTLVELLAVIVILAVILVVAVPRIMNVIDDTAKSSMETSGMLIANNAEKKYVEREILGTLDQVNDPITCSEVATYEASDYSSCTITFNNGKATIEIIGTGKFEGYICIGDKNAVECELSNSILATDALKNSGDMYQDDTVDQNYRYKGANPNNYVKFNETNDKWRIIGIFNVLGEERIKLIGPSLGTYSWDTSPSVYNSGYGYNIFETINDQTKEDGTTKADINRLLNELYMGEENQEDPVICYGARNGDATANPQKGIKKCPTSSLNSTAKEMIGDAVWNLGGIKSYGISSNVSYNTEKGTDIYFATISKTEWTGKVGLMYPSDYGYANGDMNTNCSLLSKSTCKDDNWLFNGLKDWTLSNSINNSFLVFILTPTGSVSYENAYVACDIRPVVYLKSNIKIISGDGTSGNNAYELRV